MPSLNNEEYLKPQWKCHFMPLVLPDARNGTRQAINAHVLIPPLIKTGDLKAQTGHGLYPNLTFNEVLWRTYKDKHIQGTLNMRCKIVFVQLLEPVLLVICNGAKVEENFVVSVPLHELTKHTSIWVAKLLTFLADLGSLFVSKACKYGLFTVRQIPTFKATRRTLYRQPILEVLTDFPFCTLVYSFLKSELILLMYTCLAKVTMPFKFVIGPA